MGANRVGGLSRSSLWPGGFAPLGSMAALSRLYTAASELLFMWPAASRRWAVWRLSADYTRRRLEPTVHCGPAASRRWAVWRHSSADISTRRLEPILFMWPGGFAPLGSTAALSRRLYTAASELLFMWPGGFAPLGSMAALSRLYNTAVGADCVFIVRRLRAVGQYSYSVFKPKFAADDLRSSWKNCASCMLALLQARCMWLDLFSICFLL